MRKIIARELESPLQLYSFALKLGIFIFLFFYVQDYICFPEHRYSMLVIRLCISAYFSLALYLIQRARKIYMSWIMSSVFILSAFSLSMMCYITGEGFASPYYISILQIIIAMLLLSMDIKQYILVIFCIVTQHFLLLSFIPWDIKSLMLNVFGIGFVAFASVIVHFYMHNMVKEIRALRGLLPICANCKKIRSEDGKWHHVEQYIHDHSEADFSHSICPQCMRELYPQYAEQINIALQHKTEEGV